MPECLLIDAGCAECHSPWMGPLVEGQRFSSIEEAKAWVADRERRTPGWEEHPQGGEFYDHGQGGYWLLPLPAELEVRDA